MRASTQEATTMFTLKIEHRIRDFETWKAAFGRDPIGRQQAGVLRYRVCRPPEDAHQVIIDLDFATAEQAQAFLAALRQVWSRAELSPGLARDADSAKLAPQARIVEEVDSVSY
jgi:hypothetical protein